MRSERKLPGRRSKNGTVNGFAPFHVACLHILPGLMERKQLLSHKSVMRSSLCSKVSYAHLLIPLDSDKEHCTAKYLHMINRWKCVPDMHSGLHRNCSECINFIWHIAVTLLVPIQQCEFLIFFPFRSFAYLTIRDRLPVILTKVIDLVHRRASAFSDENQQVGC